MLNSVSLAMETALFLCGLSYLAWPMFPDSHGKGFARFKSYFLE